MLRQPHGTVPKKTIFVKNDDYDYLRPKHSADIRVARKGYATVLTGVLNLGVLRGYSEVLTAVPLGHSEYSQGYSKYSRGYSEYSI